MPLSFTRLEKLLTSQGLLIQRLFTMQKQLVFLELVSLSNVEHILLYIQSKYAIPVEDRKDAFNIEYIELTDSGDIPNEYAGEMDAYDLEKSYDEIEIDTQMDPFEGGSIVERLEENYNRPVSMKNSDKEDEMTIKDVFRQLRRLKLCVQNVRYKLSVMYKNYMCCIRRDDDMECYKIDGLSTKRKLYVSLDLETFYAKIDTLTEDVRIVREGVYKVLDRNQTRHSRNLDNMLARARGVTEYSSDIWMRKQKYQAYIDKLEELMSVILRSERTIMEKISDIRSGRSDGGVKGLHDDIQRSHTISAYEAESTRISNVKHNIISNLMELKSKQERLIIDTDKIFFDNSVMIDTVIKNMSALETLR